MKQKEDRSRTDIIESIHGRERDAERNRQRDAGTERRGDRLDDARGT